MTNLKVDIIYYKTSSDFELEFNLTGCCRMRLFKDKIEDRKELVTALARDVSRSRIILVISDLYGDKNGVETISAAIGYKYTLLDKSAYSIKNDGDIYVPKGALPLVTKTGQFGGCIIECGKQSIIIVSSDRTLRHEIMRSYIHQYIFDINQVEAYNERLRHENSNNPIIDNSNILTAARKEFTTEMPKTTDEVINEISEQNDSVTVAPAKGVTIPEELADNNADTEESTEAAEEVVSDNTELLSDAEENTETADTAAEEVSENECNSAENDDISSADDNTEQVEETEEAEEELPVIEIKSQTDGFEIPKNALVDFEENDTKVNRRIFRRRKGGNIALLIISILLLLGFGLLAYYFVYLPIISGEAPNSLTKLLEDIVS